MIPDNVLKYAKEHGFKCVEYDGRWNGYECYAPYRDDPPKLSFEGLPHFIAVKGDEIRMSTHEEILARMRSDS